MIKWLAIPYVFFLFISCNDLTLPSDASLESKSDPSVEFDLFAFIDHEVTRLQNDRYTLQKIVYSPSKDSIRVLAPNWTDDLGVFKVLDTKNKSLQANFTIDTSDLGDKMVIRWKSKNTKSLIRSLEFTYTKQSISRIEIVKHQTNFMMEQSEFMVYVSNEGYRIQKESKTPFSHSQFLLESTFLHP